MFLLFHFGIVGWTESHEVPCAQPLPLWFLTPHRFVDLPEPAIPIAVTESTKTGAALLTLLAAFTAVGPTLVAQNARAGYTLDLLTCDSRLPPDEGPLDWQDSPSQLVLGSDTQKYHSGAVVGNWAIFAGVCVVWGAVAYKLGASAAHFPGALVLPALFFLSPTTASSFTILRQVFTAQRILGSFSLMLLLLGSGAVMTPILPRFFSARWEPETRRWEDTQAGSGWVSQYGELFDTYRPTRQGYAFVEFLMSVAVGILKSYRMLQDNCNYLLWGAVGVYSTYAISQIGLRPNCSPHVQYFFSSVAGLQALALTTQAIALSTAPEDPWQLVKSVAQWIVVTTEYMMMVKTLVDISVRLKGLYRAMLLLPKSVAANPPKTLLELDESETPVSVTREEMCSATDDDGLVPILGTENLLPTHCLLEDSVEPATFSELLRSQPMLRPRVFSILDSYDRRAERVVQTTLEEEIALALGLETYADASIL